MKFLAREDSEWFLNTKKKNSWVFKSLFFGANLPGNCENNF